MTTAPEPRTAFVLGGGGVLGATQVGMLKALLERDIRPDVIVGTSIGAVNGAFLAADPGSAGLDRLTQVWSQLTATPPWQDPAPARPRRTGERRAPRPRLRTHLYPPGSFLRLLRQHLPVTQFADLQVEFQCVAASVERSVAQWFTSGELAPAVMASCAVPGLFPPIKIGDEHYLDGGLVHSIPVGRALALGAERVYVLHVGRVEHPLSVPRWPWEVANVTFEIARRHRYVEEMAAIPDGVDVHALPSGADDAPAVSLLHLNASYVSGRIDTAYAAASDYLDQRT